VEVNHDWPKSHYGAENRYELPQKKGLSDSRFFQLNFFID